jgi:hypothetical protein
MNEKEDAVKKNEDRTVTVDFHYPNGTVRTPLPTGNPSLSITLVRGRITAGKSWIRYALRGPSDAIEAFLRLNRTAEIAA